MPTLREAALKVAVSQLGVTEHPPKSNWGPQVSEYLAAAGFHTPAPWCQAFVHWAYKQVGVDLGGGASVGNFEEWAKQHGELVYEPERGDIVCYRFDSDNWPDHVGIVESVSSDKSIHTIEGNTSYDSDANGGMVMRRVRRTSRCSFVRVPGDVPKPAPEPETRVDVVRDGKPWLTGQKVTNPALWAALKRASKTAKRLVIRRARGRD